MSVNRRFRDLWLLVITAAWPFAGVHAETVNCTAITTLPYIITIQGVYCLTGHLQTSMTLGNAITINANNVVLDLNGFKLGGLPAGPGTNAIGIYANQRENITIKNGTVRGFKTGIFLQDASPFTTSQGHVIEDIRADQNTYEAMTVFGNGNIIRNNHVVATGGSTTIPNINAYGITVAGPGAQVLNNSVFDVAAQGTGWAYGIVVDSAPNSVTQGNRVGNITSPNGNRFGIALQTGIDYVVTDNRLTGMQFGLFFNGATGKYMNNLTQGVSTPYSGGTAAGTTNF